MSASLGDGAAYLQGLHALGVNPAGLAANRSGEFLAQYRPLILNTNLTLMGVSHPIGAAKRTNLGLSYLSLDSSNFDKRDETGRSVGSFKSRDQIIGLHGGWPIAISGGADVLFGMSFKIVKKEVDTYNASTTAMDFGLRGFLGRRPLALGVALTNVGRGAVFVKQEVPLPTTLVFSGAYQTGTALTALVSVSRNIRERINDMTAGMLYQVTPLLSLRGRYSLPQGALSQGVQNLGAGFGFRVSPGMAFDYAFQPYERALQNAGYAGSHIITLTTKFGHQARPSSYHRSRQTGTFNDRTGEGSNFFTIKRREPAQEKPKKEEKPSKKKKTESYYKSGSQEWFIIVPQTENP